MFAMTSIPPGRGRRSPTRTSPDLPPARLIDTPATFEVLLAELRTARILAFDTESDSLYRYFYKVCVIQLSTGKADYIIDPLGLPDMAPLGELMADPDVEKIFHAAENDILVLKRDFGFEFASIFDTMLAARILGWRQVGLAALLQEHFGVKLDKRAQLTDWGRRPLTPEQLSYAHLDSHYLLPLRELLLQELKERDRWNEARETFSALPRVTYVEKPFDPEGYWRNKGARDLSPQGLAVLRELYLWRDAKARDLDLPPFKVIDDRSLAHLSEAQPQRAGELALSSYQANHFGREVLEAIRRGQGALPPPLPARAHHNGFRPDPDTMARYDRLRAWRTNCAARRGVESDVVLTNDVILAVARAAPATMEELSALDVLGPWKLQEYGPDLLNVLRK
jgi:ribonuclease D